MVNIKEIFTSIQGEGPYVGYKQLFIRFCGCNLSCKYCDTNFDSDTSIKYSIDELVDICDNNSDCHSVSLTGGEPLLYPDVINDLQEKIKLPIYLETNSTLYKNLEKVIDGITYISSDIKLPSATGIEPMWDIHDKFFNIASQKELFAKVVFNKLSDTNEIDNITSLCKKYNIELILQPVMDNKNIMVDIDFIQYYMDECLKRYHKCRLIPQVHKFLDVI